MSFNVLSCWLPLPQMGADLLEKLALGACASYRMILCWKLVSVAGPLPHWSFLLAKLQDWFSYIHPDVLHWEQWEKTVNKDSVNIRSWFCCRSPRSAPYIPPGADQASLLRMSFLHRLYQVAVHFICCVVESRIHIIQGCLFHVLKVQNRRKMYNRC